MKPTKMPSKTKKNKVRKAKEEVRRESEKKAAESLLHPKTKFYFLCMSKLCNLQCNAVLRRGRKGIWELRQRTNRKAMQKKWRLLPARKLWYGGYGREGRSCNPAPRLKKIGAFSPVCFDRITLTKRAELED